MTGGIVGKAVPRYIPFVKHVNIEEFGTFERYRDSEGHGRISMEGFQENNVDSFQALEWLELTD